MPVYQFSALSDGQAVSFNASADRLNFDQTTIAAGDLGLVSEGANLRVNVKSGPLAGKDVLLLNTTVADVATTNFTFADGSTALVGDNFWGSFNDDTSNNWTGGAGRDLLMGLGGQDFLNGGNGNDSLVGGADVDTVRGDGGNDWLEGGTGNDNLVGGGGQDTFIFREYGAANADTLSDFATAWDAIQLDAAAFMALGAAGRFASGDARFFAGTAAHDADDRIIFNSATGQIFYDADGNGAGAQQLIATVGAGRPVVAADFTVVGTPGGGGGSTGTPGDDSITGTPGNDTIDGLAGNDTINGNGGSDSLIGGAGNDLLSTGGEPNDAPDHFVGGDGNDTLDGWAVHGSVGPDTMDGGTGDDFYFIDRDDDMLADSGGVDTIRARDMDWTLATGFENLIIDNQVSEGSATGIGNALNNQMSVLWGGRLEGLGGNDTLQGGFRGDELAGGAGNDVLTGGDREDTFIFDVAPGAANADVITDFESITDTIELDGSVFGGIGFTGRFAAGDARFFSAPGANSVHDSDDRIIYNTTTGQLWFDADGNGSTTPQLIATLQGAPTLAATDINVVNSPGLVINGTSGNDSLVGTTSDDTLNGLAGNDTLDGNLGADSMVGGTGDDVYIVENEGDLVVEAENAGIDEVRSSLGTYTLPDFVNNLTVTSGFQFSGGNGNAIDNVMTGNAQDNRLFGMAGNDTLDGAGGGDWLEGGDGNDLLIGGAGAGINLLIGGGGNDTMTGGDVEDQFSFSNGGASWGNDVADGGAGRDFVTFDIDDTTQNLVVNLAAGTITSSLGTASISNIEAVQATNGNDVLIGNAASNSLFGFHGEDTFDGGLGNDFLGQSTSEPEGFADTFLFTVAPGAANADTISEWETGLDRIHLDATVMAALGASGQFSAGDGRFFAGAGVSAGHDADDRVVYNTSNGQLLYDADGSGAGDAQLLFTIGGARPVSATDIWVDNGSSGGSVINGTAGDDTLTGTSGQDTINGLGGNDSIDGLEGPDSLNGGDGNDTLNGWGFGSGDMAAETLNGGLGNDVYMVQDDGDVILADPGGIDTVRVLNGSWALAADLENLDLEDTRGISADGTGNALNNVIRSASEGGTLSGLGGDDLLIARHAQNVVTLLGGDGNDTLQGGWNTDFDGGAGNDLIIASGNSDVMAGGTGADVFQFGLSSGFGFAAINDFASGADKVRLDGNAFTEIGASGNFSAGDARFFAGAAAHDADDRIIFDAASGNLWYDADGNGSGEQVIIADVTGNVVATDITVINGTAPGGSTINGTPGNDSLVGGAGNDTINGNAGNDTLRGNAGDDSLDGGSGSDLLDGGLGNDFYVVTTGDSLTDAGGNDTVVALNSWSLASGFENLILATGAVDGSGNSASNVIQGNAANNTLRARDGNDTITGGGGSDFFDFTTAPSAGNADTITDFATVDQLRFEDGAFTAIGATGTWGASDARFWASAAGAAHDASDRVVYNTSTGQLYYDADGSGASAAVLVATLQGTPAVSATDITVI